jgi:hypothetical protein
MMNVKLSSHPHAKCLSPKHDRHVRHAKQSHLLQIIADSSKYQSKVVNRKGTRLTSTMISSWYQFHPYHRLKPVEVTWLITDDGSDKLTTKPTMSWSMTNPLLTIINNSNERWYKFIVCVGFKLLRKLKSDEKRGISQHRRCVGERCHPAWTDENVDSRNIQRTTSSKHDLKKLSRG